MKSAFRQGTNILQREATILHASIPVFLCPSLVRAPITTSLRCIASPRPSRTFSAHPRRLQEVAINASAPVKDQPTHPPSKPLRALPVCCPGCGAPSQTVEAKEAGHYTLDRNAVKTYLYHDPTSIKSSESSIYTTTLQRLDPKVLQELGIQKDELDSPPPAPTTTPTPICDRCHNLEHHHSGVSILHPSISAIRETIAESPHHRNHIYHVIDAADFPMSLVPNLQSSLKLPRLRTQNRRARHRNWVSGDRIAEVSFIITRSDLLAPLKEQVDKLMPYIQEVLRGALGRVGRKIRLGNVRMVSAHRGWWTKEVKEDIWERGGGGWMVGKVNVGKSQLFENVFPKGRGGSKDVNVRKIRSAAEREQMMEAARSMEELASIQERLVQEDEEIERAAEQPEPKTEEVESSEAGALDDLSLLPPPQPETAYPTMPLISSLPGTTASPIRIPFGNKRGELIDLPGLARTTPELESFVKPEHKSSLVMKSRVTPQRITIKQGQSLLLGGGLIRITPKTEDTVILAHPFVSLKPHVTSTLKATSFETGMQDINIDTILTKEAFDTLQSAGTAQLKWDVTKKLAGPLTDPKAGKMKPENLPFAIYSADVLIEGVGWVELVAQVRKPKGLKAVSGEANSFTTLSPHSSMTPPEEGDAFPDFEDVESSSHVRERKQDEFIPQFPEVEIFTPEGKFIAVRQPMSASLLGGPKPKSRNERKSRPRKSMKSLKGSRRGRGLGMS